uniref:Uncharacterized protein n=1 Tax=Euplotes crassus TaxID=5936 RepID=A0A7S3KUA8_EUPCR|mmetsp:Transcript_8164/g.7759  ORF Transcript_8164/g.7759 Transcript_8164/m.7759 type:complete len:168 (+) Transcript_8164:1-504(+)
MENNQGDLQTSEDKNIRKNSDSNCFEATLKNYEDILMRLNRINVPTINVKPKFEAENVPPLLSITPIHEHNFLFPQAEPLAKGKLSDLPLDNKRRLQPIDNEEKGDKSKESTPGPDKAFFHFTFNNFTVPIGGSKPSLDFCDNFAEKLKDSSLENNENKEDSKEENK